MISSVSCVPAVGETDNTVTIRWAFGYDVAWTPTGEDEVRLLTTAGVLVSRVPMRCAVVTRADSFREAEVQLPTAPFGGSFVVAFVDCQSNFRRVYTVPYRIQGVEHVPGRNLFLASVSALSSVRARDLVVNPFSRLTVRYDTKEILQWLEHSGELRSMMMEQKEACRNEKGLLDEEALCILAARCSAVSRLRFVITTAHYGDNLGYNGFGVGPYDHCYSVNRVLPKAFVAALQHRIGGNEGVDDDMMSQTIDLVSPSTDGTYEVRLMATPASTGIPYSIARSEAFTVALPAGGAIDRGIGSLSGTLTLSRYTAVAGHPLCLTYTVDSKDDALHLLNRLDSIGFVTYGRPETMIHPESMFTSIGEVALHRQLAVRAPFEPGVYDAMLFSFMQQQPVLVATTQLTVVQPSFHIDVVSGTDGGKQTLNGSAVHIVTSRSVGVMLTVSRAFVHARDRLEIIDEFASVVQHIPLQSLSGNAMPSKQHVATSVLSGTVTAALTLTIPRMVCGKFTVHYYSYMCNRIVHQCPMYMVVPESMADESSSSDVQVRVAAVLPDDAPIEVAIIAERAGTPRRAVRDVVALFLEVPHDDDTGASASANPLRDLTPTSTAIPFLDDVTGMPYLALRVLHTSLIPSRQAQRSRITASYTPLLSGAAEEYVFSFPSVSSLREMVVHSILSSTHHDEADEQSSDGWAGGDRSSGSILALSDNHARSPQRRARLALKEVRLELTVPNGGRRSTVFDTEYLKRLRKVDRVTVRVLSTVDNQPFLRVSKAIASVRIAPRAVLPLDFRVASVWHMTSKELAPTLRFSNTSATAGGPEHDRCAVRAPTSKLLVTDKEYSGKGSSVICGPVAASLRKVSFHHCVTDPRRENSDVSVRSVARSSSVTGSTVALLARRFQLIDVSGHDFCGAVLAPRSSDTCAPIVASYHITSGAPRIGDCVVLFPYGDDNETAKGQGGKGLRAVSLCSVEYATVMRPDATVGTVSLNPPLNEGPYYLGYYSEKWDGIVMTSPVFQVAESAQQAVSVNSSARFRKSSSTNVIKASVERSDNAVVQPVWNATRGEVDRAATCAVNGAPPTKQQPRSIGGFYYPTSSSSSSIAGNLSMSTPLSADIRKNGAPVVSPSVVELSSSKQRRRAQRCRMLLIAVSYNQQPFELKGPLNDVAAFESAARHFFQMGDDADDSDVVRVLSEGEADGQRRPTWNAICEGIEWLVDGAQAGDQLIFYFSGAGSATSATTSSCGSSHHCFLLPVDFDWCSRMLSPEYLMTHLIAAAPAEAAVTVIIDACYYPSTLETFRNNELRQLSSGAAEDGHLGWRALQRRRRQSGVGFAPWRCIPPPKGLHVENFCGEADDSGTGTFASMLWDVSRSSSDEAAERPGGARPHAVVYEACRGTLGFSDGAWDVFVRELGASHGLFTHFLCAALWSSRGIALGGVSTVESRCGDSSSDETAQAVALQDRSRVLSWAELHETVMRGMETMSYRQSPKLWVGSQRTLSFPVRHTSTGV